MFAFVFLIGVSCATQLPVLPAVYWFWLFVPLLLSLYLFPKSRVYLALPLGFLWLVVHGMAGLSSELPSHLIKKDVLVTGIISSLPEKNAFRTRFVFDIEVFEYQGKQIPGPKRIRISWYEKNAAVSAGQRWQFRVRLKPAHGMLNPGSFDYEKWLFERGIRATGYIRKSDENQLLRQPRVFSPTAFREKLKRSIQQVLPSSDYRGLILALAIGDRSEISDEQWQVLTATGTNHLVAISGLHIGLVAGGVYFIALFLFKRSRGLLLYLAAHKAAAILALIAAFLYAMLAGFAIPTQRALVMTAVVMLGILINRRFSFLQILSFALLAVLLLDPFAVLSAGFWLSFLAVAAILYTMQGRLKTTGWWWKWGRLQWIVTLALIPTLIFVFQQFSVVSPLANIIAVPWVSFVTVPFLLLGILFSFIDVVGESFIFIANESLKWLWIVLEYFATLSFSQWQQFAPQTWTLLPAFIGILLLLSPRGFPARYLALVFLLPLFLLKPETLEQNTLRFDLLDVGQGLSAVVQTKNHVLIYDTGPRFRGGFDTGDAVVLPFLKKMAINKVDVLLISHGDNDHIGGMQSILENIPVDKILSGAMNKTPQAQAEPCLAGTHWHWDGVDFEILHPVGREFINKGNNGSCVLRVSVKGQVILLTGDIEKAAEKQLVKQYSGKLRADILIAAHHGSNTSSSVAFIQTVSPDWVLFPAGYANRFNFPASNVLERYHRAEVKSLTTAENGAITVHLGQDEKYAPVGYRRENRRFWRESLFTE